MGVVGAALTLNFSWWFVVLGMLAYVVLGGCPLTWTGFSFEAFFGLWEFIKLSAAAILRAADNQKPLKHLGGQVCEICSDDAGITVDGDIFVACDVCTFLVCRACYEYEQKDGNQ